MQGRFTQRIRGFTLLENILALGIFVVAVTGVMNVLTKTMELVRDVRSKQTLEVALNAKAAERSKLAILEPGERRLASELDGVYFRETVSELNLSNQQGESLDGMMEISLSIYRDTIDRPLNSVTIWKNTNQGSN